MNTKWILPAVLIAVIIAAVAWMTVNKNNLDQQNQDQQTIFNPKKPNFIMGEVTYVDDKVIYFSSAGKIWTAETNNQTKFTKQNKDAKGALSNVDADRSDLKLRQTIVVYFSELPVNQVYKSDKIQIISQ